MVIVAKFASTCPSCEGAIHPGEKVEWAKGEKARHVTCPSAAESASKPTASKPAPKPRRPSRPAAFKNEQPREGAIVVELRLEPCKRHELPSFIGEVRRLDDRSAEKEGCRYYVVETQSANYANASDNEDFHGEFGGACWWVTLGGRQATPQEAESTDRDHREARARKVLAQLPRWLARQVQRSKYNVDDDARIPSGAWSYSFLRTLSGSETLYVTARALWYVTSNYDEGPRVWRRPISARDVRTIVEMINFICS